MYPKNNQSIHLHPHHSLFHKHELAKKCSQNCARKTRKHSHTQLRGIQYMCAINVTYAMYTLRIEAEDLTH